MRSWLGHTLRGVCMGVADAIPGVSGGTLALVLGIYERFVGAVSAIGPRMLRLAFTREFWRRLGAGVRSPDGMGDDEVGRYAAHALFLCFLGTGVLGAVLIGARVIPSLLDVYPAQMKGFFFGLVAASVVIPYRAVRHHGAPEIAAFLAMAVGAWLFVGLPVDRSEKASGEVVITFDAPLAEAATLRPQSAAFTTGRHGEARAKYEVAFGPAANLELDAGTTRAVVPIRARMAGAVANLAAGEIVASRGLPAPASVLQATPTTGGVDPTLWFVFIAGAIAISAMVLPGLSGAFILLMLGLYHYITFNVRSLVYDQDSDALLTVAVFAVALVVGIATFSRALSWFFRRWHDPTMAGLAGLMIGSLRKIWPFTTGLPDGSEVNRLPDAVDSTVVTAALLCALGVVLVVLLDRAGRRHTGPLDAAPEGAEAR